MVGFQAQTMRKAGMSDWRAKPRTGKAEFLRHLAIIQARLAAGETQNAIRQSLTEDSSWSISTAQFSRYVKTYTNPASEHKYATVLNEPRLLQSTRTTKSNVSASGKPLIKPVERKPLTSADFKMIRAHTDDLDLSALIGNNRA
jgi:hypothetical protein